MKTRIVQNDPNEPASREVSPTPMSSTSDDVSPPTTGWQKVRGFVRRYELVSFFALSYLIAWSTLPFGTFGAYAPVISVIIVLSIAEGLPGLARLGRRIIRWRVNWIWYAAAIAAPLLVYVAATGLNLAAGAPAPSLDQFHPWYAVFLVFAL